MSNSDWDAVHIDFVLVETAWSSEQLDMLLSDAGFWRVSDISYLDDLYIRGPRLLHNRENAITRKDNWDYIRETERRKKRCLKREGTFFLDETGTKAVYAGAGGFSIGGDN